MIGRRSVIGIAVLCALALSAIVASSASASNATAWTCAKAAGGVGFNAAHCTTADVVSSGATYKHVEIPPNTATEVSATNERTAEKTTLHSPAILEGTISGVITAIKCTKVAGMGTLTNKEEPVGEMIAHVKGTLTYTECEVTKPVGKECLVKEGKITTNELTGKTLSSTEAVIEPVTAPNFTGITIEHCTTVGLNNTFQVTGSLKASLSGATITSTHAAVTTQNTLKFGGQKAGLQGALTLGMKTPVADGEAISIT